MISQQQLFEEITLLPIEKYTEAYDLIHRFRLGLESKKSNQAENDLKIDTKMCLKTLEKVKKGDFSSFSEINDIEAYVENLRNEIN